MGGVGSGGRNRKIGLPRTESGRLVYTEMCGCGGRKSLTSTACRQCAGKAKRKPAPIVLCLCGRPKSRTSQQCRGCVLEALEATRQRTCEGCRVVFHRKTSTANAGRFCSRECAYTDMRARKEARSSRLEAERTERLRAVVARNMARMRPCETCSQPTTNGRFCSRACSRGQSLRRLAPLVTSMCSGCGASTSGLKALTLCARCMKRKHKKAHHAKWGRQRKHEDRARRKGLPRDYSITPIKLFNRDGWRCQICGDRTPKNLRGKQQPKSPTIDHILPISLGGGHTWDNVQCACHACNMAKGARPLGQMRLAV